jgi:hypothetical protein
MSASPAFTDVLYALRFSLEAGEAPGDHLAAVRSSANRALASKHVKQIVDAHNAGQPDNKMTVKSLTQVTQEEFEKMVNDMKKDPEHISVTDIYPDEKDYNRLIAVPKPNVDTAANESPETTIEEGTQDNQNPQSNQ